MLMIAIAETRRHTAQAIRRWFRRDHTAIALAFWMTFSAPVLALSDDEQEDLRRTVSTLSLQELMAMEVVNAAAKSDQKSTEAASSVTIISSEEIRRSGYRTVQDLLAGVRSFYVTYDRNYSYIGVRGFSPPGDYNSRILVLVDGHRINENVYDGAGIGNDGPIDLSLVDRVEVVRGPSSAIYGSNAFFAVVNLVTQRGGQFDGLDAEWLGASLAENTGRVSFGKTLDGGLDVLFSASALRSDGQQELYYPEFDNPSTNNGLAIGLDADENRRFYASVRQGGFAATGLFVSRTKTVPTAAYDSTFNEPGLFTKDQQGFVELTYKTPESASRSFSTRLALDDYSYYGEFPYDVGEDEPGIISNEDFADGTWLTAEVQIGTRISQRHHLVAGSGTRRNFRQNQLNLDEEVYLDDRRQSNVFGVFVQDEITLTSSLSALAGVRYDYYDTFGGTPSPRAALVYSPGPETAIKLLFGSAYRAPNVYERFYAFEGESVANPLLQPERIYTTEIVLERVLGSHLQASLSGFSNSLRDLIAETSTDDGLQFQNLERATARGIEMEVRGQWPNALRFRASYTYQDAIDELTRSDLVNSPKHLAKVNLSAPVTSYIDAGLQLQYTGPRLTVADATLPGVWITNATFATPLANQRLSLTGGVYNLFDMEYAHPVSDVHLQDRIFQNGRTWRLGLRVGL